MPPRAGSPFLASVSCLLRWVPQIPRRLHRRPSTCRPLAHPGLQPQASLPCGHSVLLPPGPSWEHRAVRTPTPPSVLPTQPSPASESEDLCTSTRGPRPQRNPMRGPPEQLLSGDLGLCPTPNTAPTRAPEAKWDSGCSPGGYLYAFLEAGRGSNLKKMMHMGPEGLGSGATGSAGGGEGPSERRRQARPPHRHSPSPSPDRGLRGARCSACRPRKRALAQGSDTPPRPVTSLALVASDHCLVWGLKHSVSHLRTHRRTFPAHRPAYKAGKQ